MDPLSPIMPVALTLGQMPGVPVKPDPAGPRQVIRHLGVAPEEILYLGDEGCGIHRVPGDL